ncbi:MAG: radical SAM protein [bacterium]|nr:radical SAM protein [bacterium]
MKVLILNGPDDPAEKDTFLVRVDRWPGRKMRKFAKDETIQVYPIWLAYSAAVLKQEGFETFLIDAMVGQLTLEETMQKVKEINPEMIVLQVSTPSIEYDLKIAQHIKETIDTAIVIVDFHASYYHKELVASPYIDFAVRGEMEMGIKEIATTFRDKGDFSQVLGITYKENGQVVANPDRPLIKDLDALPFPDRDLIDQRNYRQELCHYPPYFQLFASRGCPGRCVFCVWPGGMFRNKVRLRSVASVCDEIEHLKEKYGAKEIYLYDDTLNVSIKRVMEMCQGFIDRKLDIIWLCQMRPDHTSPEMFKMMKSCGCRLVVFGVESGSQRMLDEVIHKGITLQQALNSVRWCQEAGIEAHATFVVGVPGETKETIAETTAFLKKLKPDEFQVSVATPYPGSPYYEMIKHKPHDWRDFDGNIGESFCEDLTGEELKEAIYKMYTGYYLTPASLLKRIYKMRNWDEVMHNWQQAKGFISRTLSFRSLKKEKKSESC